MTDPDPDLDDTAHARNTLAMLRQAEDIDATARIEELEQEVEDDE